MTAPVTDVRLPSLGWLSEGRSGHSLEWCSLADGTLLLDPPDTCGTVRLRYCPRPPDGVDRAALPRLAETLERGTPAWHRARAYDPGQGARLGDLHDRHMAYRIVEEARQGRAAMSGRADILRAGFDEAGGRDGDPVGARIYVRRVSHGLLRLTLDPMGVAVTFERQRTKARDLIVRLHARVPGSEAMPCPTIWPDAWGERVDVVGLALTAQARAEACGLTGAVAVMPKRLLGTRDPD